MKVSAVIDALPEKPVKVVPTMENISEKPKHWQFDQSWLIKYRLVLHVAFWVMLVIYEGVVWGSIDGEYSQRLIISLIETPIKIIATYFTLYFLIDKFLLKRKYNTFFILILLSAIIFGVLLRIIGFFVIYPIYCVECLDMPVLFFPKILIGIFAIYSIVAIPASFHLIRTWVSHQQATQKLQQATQTLEKEKLAAELKLLKSQINPHFLFNTLNNLYVLTLKKSNKSPEMVYKLSQLMSYMLYDSNQVEVPLSKEIEYIKNYIALERMRHDDRLDVSLNIYEDLDGIRIAPLLLLAFIENSFKHGVNYHLSKAWIRIDILKKENQFIVKVENNKVGSSNTSNGTSGMGLKNVKKRLDLIYKDRYDLQIFDEDDNFLVVLKLNIDQEFSLVNP